MNIRRIALSLLPLIMALSAFGYEKPVHKAISRAAFDQIQVDMLLKLGIPNTQKIYGFRLKDILAEGTYDEDDGLRARSHFFDPVHLEPLQEPYPLCPPLGARADIWAIEPESVTGNDFSLDQAKVDYLASFFGRDVDTRFMLTRKLFLDLGHVIHLVQDMAQPEHTRNDQHLTGDPQPSIWEAWGLQNLSDENAAPVPFSGYPTPRLDGYASYFHTEDTLGGRPAGKGIADYSNLNFVTQDTNYHDENPNWRCPGTPLPPLRKCVYFDYPKIAEAARREVIVDERVRDSFGTFRTETVIEEIFTSFVRDNVTGVVENDPNHTYLSSIDFELKDVACDKLYSLSDDSYLSRAALLIPRAVGYSAALIDHLFRGRIDAQWQPVNGMPGVYDVTITNRSAERIGGDALVFLAYRAQPSYFDSSGTDDLKPIAGGQIADLVLDPFLGLDPGQSVTLQRITVPFLRSGDEVTVFERRVMVVGTLGTEPQAMISLVQPAGNGLRFVLTPIPDLIHWSVLCPGKTYFEDPQKPNEISVPLTMTNDCRAIIRHDEIATPGYEGARVFLGYRVFRNGALVEDLTAVIDASDTAVGGCHSKTKSWQCDRFLQRIGNCVPPPPGYQGPKCEATTEPWGR